MKKTLGIGDWKELLKFVFENKHSSFYLDKFTAAGFDPNAGFNSFEDIEKIPLTTKEELLDFGHENLLFVPEEDVVTMSATSGTTSNKPMVTYNTPSSKAVRKDLETGDFGRMLILFGPLRASSIMYYTFLINRMSMIGDIHNLPATISLAARAKIRTILSTPTMMIVLKKYLENDPSLFSTLKYIRLTGELVTPSKKECIQSLYPDQEVFTLYGSGEIGKCAIQCSMLARAHDEILLHPMNEHFFLEILDPETGKHVPDGQDGELVVTDFTNLATPLIRYRTGDRACFVDKQCECDNKEPLLLVKGRMFNDFVKAGGFEIRRDMIETPLLRLKEFLTPHFEVRMKEEYLDNKPKISMELTVMVNQNVQATESLKEKIRSEFMEYFRVSPSMNLKEAVLTGLFNPLEVRFAELSSVSGKAVAKIMLAEI